MESHFLDFGEPLDSESDLRSEVAARTVDAVSNHPDFEFIEYRILGEGEQASEIVVVDCRCDGVPSRNRIGIKYRERLGLRFFLDMSLQPEVRALRSDFPTTAHQNHVGENEPASLCLYFESWSEVRRTWTPQRHLSRIQWWLAETANETLHRTDQPVEPIYFNSRFELVIPDDFVKEEEQADKILVVEARGDGGGRENRVLVGHFVPSNSAPGEGSASVQCITLTLPAIVHGRIERIPTNLGDLHDQLESRGAPVQQALIQKLKNLAGEAGLSPTASNYCLLVLRIPIKRDYQEVPELVQIKGFALSASLGELGVKLGALMPLHEGKHYRELLIGGTVTETAEDWREIQVDPIEILHPFTMETARQSSGIESAGPRGVLAGVGAVGSALALIWKRDGWGSWQCIDPDVLKPHNLARHIGFEFQVGLSKIDVLQQLDELLMPGFAGEAPNILGSASDFRDANVCDALESAELIVDATTTLDVPRNIASRDSLGRAASVFVTPSGLESVLLMEDAERTTRLDCLEAQYYRAVINEDWGEDHLRGTGLLWVGAGCRHLSTVMSNDVVLLHSATLAKQVRLRSEEANAVIRIWRSDEESGGVNVSIIEVDKMLVEAIEELRVVWDEGVRRKVRVLREKNLPNETGGVILGYFDLANNSVYVVDVLPAPQDSQGDVTGFTRGIDGLAQAVKRSSDRTAGIVNYIGEWHSHPSGSSAQPSSADFYQMAHLAHELQRDGLPALMLITGEREERWLIGDGRVKAGR